jgi:tripeptidyl-peptidase-1
MVRVTGILSSLVPLSWAGIHEQMLKMDNSWNNVGQGAEDEKLQLTFMVKQTNLDALEASLMSVSDPQSSRYGQHLSNQQVHDLVAPEPKSVQSVMAFLKGHGVEGVSVTPNSDIITAEVTLAQAERLLDTTYFRFEHSESGHVAHRTLSYSLPAEVASHVDFVAPTVRLPAWRKSSIVNAGNSSLNTPAVLRELYNVHDEMGKHPKKSSGGHRLS